MRSDWHFEFGVGLLFASLSFVACGGRAGLLGGEVDEKSGGTAGSGAHVVAGGPGAVMAGAGGSAGELTAVGGAPIIAGNGGVGGGRGGADAGAAGTELGNDRPFPETVLDDVPVSAEVAPRKWSSDPYVLACGSRDCAIFSNQGGSGLLQHITFPNPTGLTIGFESYVGRVAGGRTQISSDVFGMVSDGDRYLLVWREYYAGRSRWQARRMLASSKAWLDPEPVSLEGWSDEYSTRPALAWDGKHVLTVLPGEKTADVALFRTDTRNLEQVSRIKVPFGGGYVRAASAKEGEFVVVESKSWTNPGEATAQRFTYDDNGLSAPTAVKLPKAEAHISVSFTARPGAYLFGWCERLNGDTQVSLLAATTLHEHKQVTAVKANGARFAFTQGRLLGITSNGSMVALNPETLEMLPPPPRLDRAYRVDIATRPDGEAIVGHAGWAGEAIHVHRVRAGASDSSEALVRQSASADQMLLALASDGNQYLVAWLEGGVVLFRRFDLQLAPIDSAPWSLPEIATPDQAVTQPVRLRMGAVSGRFLLTWQMYGQAPQVAFLDPAARKLYQIQEIGDASLTPQEVVTDGAHVWIPLVEKSPTELQPYLHAAWVRVAELEPSAREFTLSARLSPDRRAVKEASWAPIGGGYAAIWSEGSSSAYSTLHAQAYDQSLNAEASSHSFGAGRSVRDWSSSVRSSGGLRVVAHPTTSRGLVVASLQEGISAGLVSSPVDALELTEFPEKHPEPGAVPREDANIVALKNGCWLVTWNQPGSGDEPLFSRRVCDDSGTLRMHALQRWGLGRPRAPSDGVLSVTTDAEKVVFAMGAFDPTVGAERVRLSFIPQPNEL